MSRLASVLLALSIICSASHRHSGSRSGQAGVFDYYVLVLSWSPEFCYSHPSAAQCSAHSGFVVHGLWPQNNNGSYPLNCQTSQPPPSDPSSMAGIMPPEIIQHEWQQHGTCSGLNGGAYFALIRKAFQTIKIPARLQSPGSSFTLTPKELKQAFEQANPNLSAPDIAVQLRGNYLSAVELCLTKGEQPAPIACSNIRDTRAGTFVVPPVR
jgi:ribonuclease T2